VLEPQQHAVEAVEAVERRIFGAEAQPHLLQRLPAVQRDEAGALAEIGHQRLLADRPLADRIGEGEVLALPRRRGQSIAQIVAAAEMSGGQILKPSRRIISPSSA
jgi:hypothetical protein